MQERQADSQFLEQVLGCISGSEFTFVSLLQVLRHECLLPIIRQHHPTLHELQRVLGAHTPQRNKHGKR